MITTYSNYNYNSAINLKAPKGDTAFVDDFEVFILAE